MGPPIHAGTGTFPVTLAECRERFRRAARALGAGLEEYPITATGPDGARLAVDVAVLDGPPSADTTTAEDGRALLVLGGVHGVEGFTASAQQRRLLERLRREGVPPGVRVVVVHALNPWGMAWWRRQNESNVDLNRNSGRDGTEPPHNEAYDAVHPLLVPGADGDDSLDDDAFVVALHELTERHGVPWVQAAISAGQYHRPDGLYFGGERTEASTRILAEIVARHLDAARHVTVVDLHTGHGRYGTATLLSHAPVGSPGDRWVRSTFAGLTIETVGPAVDAPLAHKAGQLALGVGGLVPGATFRTTTLEIGTVSEIPMILAERAEHRVHRLGDRSDPADAAVVVHHHRCSTPDDVEWERAALAAADDVLGRALVELTERRDDAGESAGGSRGERRGHGGVDELDES